MHSTAPHLDRRPLALIFRSPLFNASEGFVQAQAAGLERYQALVAGIEAKGHVCPALADRLLLPANRMEACRMTLFGDFTPLLRRLAMRRPRLVHAHFGTDGLRALPLARALGVPLVTSLRGYDVYRKDAALLLSGRLSSLRYALGRGRLAREGALFLAVSDAVRRRAIALGFPEARVVTHYNGVNLSRFQPGTGPRAPMILHVGRLVEKKGSGLLIDAFARFAARTDRVELVVAGDGPLRPSLERRAASLGLGNRVRFLGHVPAARIVELMSRAALLAAPSLRASDGDAEGLPNVVVESAAAGLPVVASDHTGIPEAVVHGKTGLLVPEGRVAPLAEALEDLLRSDQIRERMGSAARRHAEEHFDARRHNARLEALYDRVSASAPRAADGDDPRTLSSATDTV